MAFFDRFRPLVRVGVSETLFSFHGKHVDARFAPVVRIDSGGKLIEVGEEARTSSGGTLIEFFGPDSLDRHMDDSQFQDSFRKFCRFGLLMALPENKLIVKPRVVVSGARALRPILRRDTAVILARSLRAAGASIVEFDEIM